ncbi:MULTISPECIES: hydantoinase/oxoprolinase family protein [unclassified Rhizobium]|uniref:hydantoinase/oxoprolinase family protein n=1 Tax=unclassified Rhizobium TaxID=2613769 RepID=UPI001ADB3C52|nr:MULTISPECIES: hydantoinase/oxoprolinase family protein [unclassified Rhizobium]MBO9100624.1 hydantoinase/oxoprolinase family protein [Rhizobium sp. L58/93]MBO9136014.1 hydantoinase/oxoprolinase family protein [Rhizobium sp. B209b/85]MBO9171326.1 hydantoinase/oxoprolinase family protein [Rhizobium sp. L245/93]MBO9187193.1 hydantoinase/oxoprolinase family protein [Rhizobium sp. E27B/91]QXZ87879.1 hydantoinase/oxoprolinase family protein [Rhizobium sp. K1/93]
MAKTRVAVDVGGTFTDICIMDEETGSIRIEKTASTPDDPMQAIMNGIEQGRIELSEVTMFSHGTTVATNALITRRLPRTAMVCTEGFRDVVEIRRANKEDLWDTYKDVAKPYIPRRDRLTVGERVDAEGTVLEALNEDDAHRVAAILKKRGIKSIAVCFMNSYVNGANERRMRDILKASMPEVPVSISSEVMPEIFEHERFSTTMANAVCAPVVVDYVSRLGEKLAAGGYQRDLLLLHSGGGVMTPASVIDFSARLAGSGIAAGAIASRFIGNLCGFQNSIGFDMGGTSTDVSLAWNGQSRITKDWYIEFGYPIRFPSIEVLTIGAGGGSLAWQDEGGSLRNGPQSAGANPGPACYRNGNRIATNTDANVVLGRLGSSLAGGKITLDPALAEEAVQETVATPFGMELHAAAEAIVAVANANMANAVRLMSISRGYDPRDFALVAFGGAGALHGAAVARELSIPTVIVPPNPGVTSALGCLLVDVQHDFSESFMTDASIVAPAELEAAFQRMEAQASERLLHEGIAPQDMALQRTVEMMYQGQWRSLAISAPARIVSIASLIDAFHAEHEREFNYRRDEAPVAIFRVAVKAIGLVPKAELPKYPVRDHAPAPLDRRAVWFDGKSYDAAIYQREGLEAGATISGPAIVEQFDSTTVVPPGMSARVDAFLNILIGTKG